MAPSSLAQWFGAFGTIAAVIVALFKDPILAWRRKPQLVATCTKKSPWTGRVPYHVTRKSDGTLLWSGYAYWVRVRVENVGRTRAEKVQVYASKLAKRALDNTFEDVSSFLPFKHAVGESSGRFSRGNTRWNFTEDGSLLRHCFYFRSSRQSPSRAERSCKYHDWSTTDGGTHRGRYFAAGKVPINTENRCPPTVPIASLGDNDAP
jgi:hypothetical protein